MQKSLYTKDSYHNKKKHKCNVHYKKLIKNILKYISLFMVFCALVAACAFLTLNYIIKNETTVVIPDLVGKHVIYSLELLTGLGLNIKVKGSEYSRTIPKNHVIYQDPSPGDILKTGRDVRIIFSKGEQAILMPNLEGLTLQQANILLEKNDLSLNTISKTYNTKISENKIISQYPLPDKNISRKSSIDLLISSGEAPFSFMLPDFKGSRLNNAILTLEQSGLVPGNITFQYKKSAPKNIVIDQTPPSGYRVTQNDEVHLVINRRPDEQNRKIDIKEINGVNLFRYRTDFNFLKTHIKIVLNIYGTSNCIFDEYVKPNRELWISVPKNTIATLFLYKDEELVITKVYDTM